MRSPKSGFFFSHNKKFLATKLYTFYNIYINYQLEGWKMTFDTIRDLIVEQLGVDADIVEMDTNLMKDLEADSLDAVEIILGVEEEYGIEIPDEEAEKFETVRDLVNYVDENVE